MKKNTKGSSMPGRYGRNCSLIILCLFFSIISNASVTITGTITGEDGDPLQGVTVTVKNTSVATITNEKGFYSLNNIPENSVLLITLVGHEPEEITVDKRTVINVRLTRQTGQLDEVVVIGYGTAKRATLTGSIAKVEGKTLVQQPIQNPVLGLQGRVAGMYMTTASGNLGANVNVVIRGNNNILSSSNPLYIIDGVPMPSTGINAATIGGATGSQSPFVNLNSADIESVEVLKDADATAIYGTRGANGVIIISTKKGKGGPTRGSIDFYRGFQTAVNKLDLLNTPQYIQMRKDAFAADGITNLTAVNAFDILEWGEERYTDFQDLLFGKTEAITDAQASIQGGSENTAFMLALGFRDENGVLMGKNNQKKATARLNVNHRSSNNRFTANVTLSYTLMKTATIGTSGFSYAWLAPNLPLLDEATGKPYFHPGNASNTQSPLKQNYSSTDLKNYQFVSSGSLAYNILNNLQLKVDASFTRLDYDGIERYRNGYFSPYASIDYENTAYFGTNYQHTYNVEPQLNYNLRIGKNKLTAMIGSTFQETIGGGQIVNADNFASELLMDNLASASSIYSYSNTYNEYKFNSLFARATYAFGEKYLFNATFRRDGSSRFAPENRFGDFWAIGGGWVLSKEDFFRDALPFVSFAKIRSSYGLTGNDAISNYQYMETFAATTYPYNYEPGLYANRLGNPSFKWESTKKFEVALELNLFNNRITTTTAFFNNVGSNQLVNYPVATQTGWTSYVANLDGAKIRNRGLEFEFTTHNIKTRDFNWHTSFNITTFKNLLVSFPNLSSSTYSNTYEVGKPINAYRRYQFDGIDPATGTPLLVDQNKDGLITSVGDYISYGNADASFYGGLGNTFTYKGFSVDVFFQFTRRPYANSYINSSNASQPGIIYNLPAFLLEGVWRKPGDQATRPRLSTQNSGAFYTAYNNYRLSTAALEDASFARLKNLTVSYTLPASVVSRLKLTNIRVYMLGQNLLTITKYKGYDPETAGTVTPPMRVYTFGANISF